MRRLARHRHLAVAVGGAAVGAVAVAAVFFSPALRTWVGSVLAAVLTAYLSTHPRKVLQWFVRLFRPSREGPPPVVVSVQTVDADSVVTRDAGSAREVAAIGHGVRIFVENASDQLVHLTALRPEVVGRTPVTGDLSRHAAQVPLRRFEALLDEQPPRLRPLPLSEGGDGADFPFSLAAGESEVFDLVARTDDGVVSWLLHLGWVSRGFGGTVRIDLRGQPLQTAARHSQPSGARP